MSDGPSPSGSTSPVRPSARRPPQRSPSGDGGPGTSSRPPRRNNAVPTRRQRARRNNNGAAPDNGGTAPEAGLGRHRAVCWTLRLPDEVADAAVHGSDLERKLITFIGTGLDYLCYGVEAGDGGYRHLQGYAEFPSALRLPQIKRILGFNDIHIERRHGTQQQAIDYTKGDYTNAAGVYKPANEFWFEFGTRHADPTTGKSKSVNEIFERLRSGAAYTPTLVTECGLNGPQFFQYHRAFAAAEQFFTPRRTVQPEIHVRWGEPGTGKTRFAVDNGAAILGWRTPFMLGYRGTEEVVCIDDFNPHDMPRSVFLQLTDRYQCSVEVKGAVLPWNPRVIYITSNYDPKGWYSTGDWDAAVRRRLTSIVNCV